MERMTCRAGVPFMANSSGSVVGANRMVVVSRLSITQMLPLALESQIESIPVAGQVLGPAFPGVVGFLAPRFFSVGLVGAGFTTLISVSLTMTYICLDVMRRDWRFTKENKTFQVIFALWIAVPALLTPFWALPALLKAIVAMIGNLLLAPVAIAVIFYFVNRRQMGEFKANARRNLLLGATLVFALALAMAGAVRFFR